MSQPEWIVEAEVYRDYAMASHALFIRRVSRDHHRVEILGEFGWEPHTPGSYMRPTVFFEVAPAKRLAESLHAAGIRMDSQIESEGHRGALEFHLGDMRRLVEKSLGVSMPERRP